MRLMCDEMLLRLGRWLRAAGYDAAIAEGAADDAALIARCAAERRVLVTRDRRLAALGRAAVPVVRLTMNRLDAQACALKKRAGDRLAACPVYPLRDRQHGAGPGAARDGGPGPAGLAHGGRAGAAMPGLRAALLAGRARSPHAGTARRLSAYDPGA